MNVRLASLYSGGKDSAFSLYLAEQAGHVITHILNIRSLKGDSWIFHTPNQDAVPELARLMGKELICGTTGGSEEEDMNALRTILSGLDVEGVVVGAVHSDYQWDRINMICGDLGLKVIAPLWRKDQEMLMHEMIGANIKAMIVGVYADGFDESWLGRMIDEDTLKDLNALKKKHGISVMGEGGEYESLTIDSPLQSGPLRIRSSKKEWKNMSGTMTVDLY